MKKKTFLPALATFVILAAILAFIPNLSSPTSARTLPTHDLVPTPAEPEPAPKLQDPDGLSQIVVEGRPHLSQGEGSFEAEILELINQERWANGQLPPLKGEDTLDIAAETHSLNMAARDFFAHCDLDTGESPWDRMATAGYTGFSRAGENIAAGYSTPQSVMSAWMASSGHRSNILSSSYREVGVGYHYETGDAGNVRLDNNGNCRADQTSGPFYRYWTQNFGRRNTVYPIVINREAIETGYRSVMLYIYGAGWAQDMRLCNQYSQWTDWTPFASDFPWTLTAGDGQKTVTVALRKDGVIRFASDEIALNETTTVFQTPPGNLLFLPLVTKGIFGMPTCIESFPGP